MGILVEKISLKIYKNMTKKYICAESRNKYIAMAIKQERIKKIDSQHHVRRDMVYMVALSCSAICTSQKCHVKLTCSMNSPTMI